MTWLLTKLVTVHPPCWSLVTNGLTTDQVGYYPPTLLVTLIPSFGSQPHCPPSKSIMLCWLVNSYFSSDIWNMSKKMPHFWEMQQNGTQLFAIVTYKHFLGTRKSIIRHFDALYSYSNVSNVKYTEILCMELRTVISRLLHCIHYRKIKM